MRGRKLWGIAIVIAMACDGRPPAPIAPTMTIAPAAPRDAPVETGDEIDFWTHGETTRVLDDFGTHLADSTSGTCREGWSCRTGMYVDLLEVPAAPSKKVAGACTALPPAFCQVGAAPAVVDDGALDRCRDRLLEGRGLGRYEGDALVLTTKGAELVAQSALSNELAAVALEYSPATTALAAAALAGGARERDRATPWCNALVDELQDPRPSTISRSLTCLAHAATAGAHDVLARWPGCPCGERGRLVGDVCIEGRSTRRPFVDAPVDARLVPAIAEATRRANEVLGKRGWALDGLGLVGCHILRFERGGNMRGLATQPRPTLHAEDVSAHSSAVACDLVTAWVDRGPTSDGPAGYSVEMAFWSLADPAGNRSVRDRRQLGSELHARALAAGGEGAYFRAIARRTPEPSRRSASAFTFAVVRNALVDAGFVVYTPATNGAHFNHLHFHLPANAEAWRELSTDATSVERREQLVADALARASGHRP